MTPIRLRPSLAGPRRQRGAALLTAMIIVTLVATLASAMVWQQWRAVQVESGERARVQAAWILSGALDFARLILREDMRSASGRQFTALTEPWATPLAEARLSTFLAVDKANANDGPEAFLSGNISDAQARYNLKNLIVVDPGAAYEKELATLSLLCQIVGVDAGIAMRIATGLRASSTTAASGAGTSALAPLRPDTIEQLSWLGVDSATLRALRPYVVLLPALTPVNVNTASPQVLAAAMGLDLASAERVVTQRQRNPFKDVNEIKTQVPLLSPEALAKLGVRSNFFEVHGRLRLVDRVLVERSLVQRIPGSGQVNVLQRERVASLEQVGT